MSDGTSWIALFRALNVAGHGKVKMADLRAALTAAGLADVSTYIQSGNALFRSELAAGPLTERIADAVRTTLGLETAVMLRTAKEMRALVERGHPYDEADDGRVGVAFLTEAPGDPFALDPDSIAPECYDVRGADLVMHVPNGFGRANLTNARIERVFGVQATTRNWRTVRALAERAC